MECDICERTSEEVREFFCAACARNAAYLPRLDYAQILLEKNVLSLHVESVVNTGNPAAGNERLSHSIADGKVWDSEVQQVNVSEVKRRMDQISLDKQQTRKEIEELQAQINGLRTKLAKKRASLNAVQGTAPKRWQDEIARNGLAASKTTSSLMQLQHRLATSRTMLCREAASLMRLRQRRRQKDASARVLYSIAGLTLPDLQEISNVRCADLSAVLGSVAHLTLLVAFYLGIRLPAEIIAPYSNYPLTTINTPLASYRESKIESLRSSSSASTPSSPLASRDPLGNSLKPRPLFIGSENREQRIYNFQKNEPMAFNMFVEGIALLAWDVAWLCRSQGFTAGTNSWEEICNVGRNLHQLLVANPHAPSVAKQSDRTQRKQTSQLEKSSSQTDESPKEAAGKLGQYSDLSAIDASHRRSQNDLLWAWNYLSWQAVATSLRKTLLTEITSAEWEVLQDQEWDDGTEQFNDPVFVKAPALDTNQFDDARSIMTARTRLDNEETALNKPSGTSGWTKLKSREKS